MSISSLASFGLTVKKSVNEGGEDIVLGQYGKYGQEHGNLFR